MRIFFVAPTTTRKAKKCVNGWGSMFLTVTPDGNGAALPHGEDAARAALPNVREARCAWPGSESDGFHRYRGTGWMKEPCRRASTRREDLGGCRCQPST